MTWTAPVVVRSGGAPNAPEPELLRGLLDWHRTTLLLKCAGLDGGQLARASVAGSNLSLLGLVRHLAKVERIWFRRRFRGEAVEMLYSTPEWKDADFEDLDPARAEAEYAQLLAEQEAARRAVEDAPLDATFVGADGKEISLRLVFVHMIGEYARHNGHADLIRQGVDGVTGA
ncbi:DinB family protein [Micromonospora sp. NBC_01796]|uniref:DinB family protein n=1 Tax=Micromonospora sp. NBC_01796 TaxID=2975987 RepID=UPI002DDBFDB1|nr:DinB family protein [Micromonospora sp. NBC_01796]WSA87476.1 DinB family protein [Micromonospora sp. NBC_01796]